MKLKVAIKRKVPAADPPGNTNEALKARGSVAGQDAPTAQVPDRHQKAQVPTICRKCGYAPALHRTLARHEAKCSLVLPADEMGPAEDENVWDEAFAIQAREKEFKEFDPRDAPMAPSTLLRQMQEGMTGLIAMVKLACFPKTRRGYRRSKKEGHVDAFDGEQWVPVPIASVLDRLLPHIRDELAMAISAAQVGGTLNHRHLARFCSEVAVGLSWDIVPSSATPVRKPERNNSARVILRALQRMLEYGRGAEGCCR
jgi:hypothetical protein